MWILADGILATRKFVRHKPQLKIIKSAIFYIVKGHFVKSDPLKQVVCRLWFLQCVKTKKNGKTFF